MRNSIAWSLALLLICLATSGAPLRAEPASAGVEQPWVTEDVSIPSAASVKLAATLWLPTGRGNGPFPVVIWIEGTGPATRGGVYPLFDRLLLDGIAVFEYDKRGVGKSTGRFVDSLAANRQDVSAIVAYLRTCGEIDSKRIALIGHSLGAIVAPAVAANDASLAGIVMLAGPVGDGKAIFKASMAQKLAAGGATSEGIQRATGASARLMKARSRGASSEVIARRREEAIKSFMAFNFTRTQAEGAVAAFDTPGVLDLWKSDLGHTLSEVRAPVLAMFASADRWVPTFQSLPAAKTALRHNPDGTVVELPGLDHDFSHSGATRYMATPELVEVVGEWLDAHLHPAKAIITAN